jgi:hypothetical protein
MSIVAFARAEGASSDPGAAKRGTEYLVREFYPVFSEDDFLNLPAHHIYPRDDDRRGGVAAIQREDIEAGPGLRFLSSIQRL